MPQFLGCFGFGLKPLRCPYTIYFWIDVTERILSLFDYIVFFSMSFFLFCISNQYHLLARTITIFFIFMQRVFEIVTITKRILSCSYWVRSADEIIITEMFFKEYVEENSKASKIQKGNAYHFWLVTWKYNLHPTVWIK